MELMIQSHQPGQGTGSRRGKREAKGGRNRGERPEGGVLQQGQRGSSHSGIPDMPSKNHSETPLTLGQTLDFTDS